MCVFVCVCVYVCMRVAGCLCVSVSPGSQHRGKRPEPCRGQPVRRPFKRFPATGLENEPERFLNQRSSAHKLSSEKRERVNEPRGMLARPGDGGRVGPETEDLAFVDPDGARLFRFM